MKRTYQRGEMYYADLGHGVGSEQEGRRPVVIIQNNVGNKHTHDPNAASFCSRILFIQDGVIFHELRRKVPTETREEFYARILQVMAQMGGGSANVL